MLIKPTYVIDLRIKSSKNIKTPKKVNQARLIDEISVVITDGNQTLRDYLLAQYIVLAGPLSPQRSAKFPDHLYISCYYIVLEGISMPESYILYKRKPYNEFEFVNSSSPMVCDYWFRAIGKNAGKFFIPTGFGLPYGKSKQGWYFIKLVDTENAKLINLEDNELCDSSKKFKAPISKKQVMKFLKE
jgi:hypothetical protein